MNNNTQNKISVSPNTISRKAFIQGAIISSVSAGLLIKNAMKVFAEETTPLNNVNKGRFEYNSTGQGDSDVVIDNKHLPYYFTTTIVKNGSKYIASIEHSSITANSFINYYAVDSEANPPFPTSQVVDVEAHTLTLEFDGYEGQSIGISVVNPKSV